MPVLYEKHNHVGYLTFSRPDARNCWGPDYNEELPARCEAIADDDDVRVVVLTGDERGGAFSAGANIRDPKTHGPETAADFIKGLAKKPRYAGTALIELQKPVICAVNGYAVGIGAPLAMPISVARRTSLSINSSEKVWVRLGSSSLGSDVSVM